MSRLPVSDLDVRFSSPGAVPVPWPEAEAHLRRAGVFWLTTVRPEGRPHVTPLLTVWSDDALHFCTGPTERKGRNLTANRQVILTTGTDATDSGMDIVVEGEAVIVSDEDTLRGLAARWAEKYPGWEFAVHDGAFLNEEGGRADVYRVSPTTVFGFSKGEMFGQTRYRFPAEGSGEA